MSSIASEKQDENGKAPSCEGDRHGDIHLDGRLDRNLAGVGINAPGRWAIVGVMLLAIGFVLGLAAAGDRVFAVELDLMLTVQRLSWPWLDWLAWASSRGGDAWPGLLLFSTLAVALCAWRGRGDLVLFILLATALRAVGPPLKWLFASPRPPADMVMIFEHADGFGYPSGHAFGAALVFGAMDMVLPQVAPRPALAVAIRVFALAMIVLVALSRVRLGVHWPTDVVGGMAFGLGLLCLLQAAFLVHARGAVRA